VKRLPAILSVLALAACALPQDAERLVVQRGRDEVVVGARYAGRETNPIDEIQIELAQAPRFELHMPDGTWLKSTEITHETMQQHGAKVESDARGSFGAYATDTSHHWWMGRYAFVLVYTRPSDGTSTLRLSACGQSLPQLLRSADGAIYGFPMSVEDFERVFGPVTRRERFGIITGATCL
jgi:hypothetical protein